LEHLSTTSEPITRLLQGSSYCPFFWYPKKRKDCCTC
jgi:hypothetical protein